MSMTASTNGRPPHGRQLSVFGVEARPPTPMDLEGLLAGAGQVTRMGGTARVSIVVEAAWRAVALRAECALRGLVSTCEPATIEGHVAAETPEPAEALFGRAPGGIAFRTAYSTALAPLGVRWLRGAVKHPPDRFALDGRRLRLWAVAAGSPDGVNAFLLRLGTRAPGHGETETEPVWDAVGAALAGAGLPAVLLGPRAEGPAYRIVGRRRIARLAELIGEPPRQAPPGEWPM
jgi:hypothetical protein